MRNRQTVLRLEESAKTVPSVREDVSKYLSERCIEEVKQLTKGIKVYEVLQVTKGIQVDDLTRYEELVDKEVRKEGIDLSQKPSRDVDSPFSGSSDSVRMKIWLPESFEAKLPARGRGSMIEDAVREYVKTPFGSRSHRIQVKEDILQAVKSDEVPESSLAQEWMELNYVDSAIEWYEDEDLSMDELRDRGSQISQKNREARVGVLKTAVENSEDRATEFDLVEFCERAFDVSEETAKKYVEDSELIKTVTTYVWDDAKLYKSDGVEHVEGSSTSATDAANYVQQCPVSAYCDISPEFGNLPEEVEVRRFVEIALDSLFNDFTRDGDLVVEKSQQEAEAARENIESDILFELDQVVEEFGFDYFEQSRELKEVLGELSYTESDEWGELSEKVREEGPRTVHTSYNDIECIEEVCRDSSNNFGLAVPETGSPLLVYNEDMVDGVREVHLANKEYLRFGPKSLRHPFDDETEYEYAYDSITEYPKYIDAYERDELPEHLAEFFERKRDSMVFTSVEDVRKYFFEDSEKNWDEEAIVQEAQAIVDGQ